MILIMIKSFTILTFIFRIDYSKKGQYINDWISIMVVVSDYLFNLRNFSFKVRAKLFLNGYMI